MGFCHVKWNVEAICWPSHQAPRETGRGHVSSRLHLGPHLGKDLLKDWEFLKATLAWRMRNSFLQKTCHFYPELTEYGASSSASCTTVLLYRYIFPPAPGCNLLPVRQNVLSLKNTWILGASVVAQWIRKDKTQSLINGRKGITKWWF